MTYIVKSPMTVSLVKKINEAAIKEDFDVKVSCGSVIVDAKSFLALLTLIGKNVNLVTSDSVNPKEFLSFARKF